MKNLLLIMCLMTSSSVMVAQQQMTLEIIIEIAMFKRDGTPQGRLNPLFEVKTPNIAENNFDPKLYRMPVTGDDIIETNKDDALTKDKNVSPDGNYK